MTKPTLEDAIKLMDRVASDFEFSTMDRVRDGRMLNEDADFEIRTMRLAVQTLKWCDRRKELLRILNDCSDSDLKLVEQVKRVFPGAQVGIYRNAE